MLRRFKARGEFTRILILSSKSYWDLLGDKDRNRLSFHFLLNIGPWISANAKWNLLDLVFPEAQDTCTAHPQISEMWRICKWSWRAAGERCLKLWVGVYETPISIVQQRRLVSGAVLCCVQYVHCTVNINVFTVHLCPVCIYMSDIGGMNKGRDH